VRKVIAVVAILLFSAPAADACTLGVLTHFTEVARNLSVTVKFEGRPLASANVTLSSVDAIEPVTSTTTGHDGTALLRDLPPGRYFLEIQHRGIPAGRDQVEVRSRASAQAKSRLNYQWGKAPTEVRQISGRIVDLRPQGDTVVAMLINPRAEVPIVGARLQVQHPRNNSTYSGVSDRGASSPWSASQTEPTSCKCRMDRIQTTLRFSSFD